MTSLLDLENAILSPRRRFGPYSAGTILPAGVNPLIPFSAQVTTREVGTDELVITENPVQQGAEVTDHSYKKAASVLVEVGWSNSGIQSLVNDVEAVSTLLTGDGTGGFNYSDQIYNQLLQLQLSRIPFDLTTGKRAYTNMLIRAMSQPTTSETENALFVTMICQQVILTQTQDVTFPPSNVQANPASTGSTASVGTVQPSVQPFNPSSYPTLQFLQGR